MEIGRVLKKQRKKHTARKSLRNPNTDRYYAQIENHPSTKLLSKYTDDAMNPNFSGSGHIPFHSYQNDNVKERSYVVSSFRSSSWQEGDNTFQKRGRGWRRGRRGRGLPKQGNFRKHRPSNYTGDGTAYNYGKEHKSLMPFEYSTNKWLNRSSSPEKFEFEHVERRYDAREYRNSSFEEDSNMWRDDSEHVNDDFERSQDFYREPHYDTRWEKNHSYSDVSDTENNRQRRYGIKHRLGSHEKISEDGYVKQYKMYKVSSDLVDRKPGKQPVPLLKSCISTNSSHPRSRSSESSRNHAAHSKGHHSRSGIKDFNNSSGNLHDGQNNTNNDDRCTNGRDATKDMSKSEYRKEKSSVASASTRHQLSDDKNQSHTPEDFSNVKNSSQIMSGKKTAPLVVSKRKNDSGLDSRTNCPDNSNKPVGLTRSSKYMEISDTCLNAQSQSKLDSISTLLSDSSFDVGGIEKRSNGSPLKSSKSLQTSEHRTVLLELNADRTSDKLSDQRNDQNCSGDWNPHKTDENSSNSCLVKSLPVSSTSIEDQNLSKPPLILQNSTESDNTNNSELSSVVVVCSDKSSVNHVPVASNSTEAANNIRNIDQEKSDVPIPSYPNMKTPKSRVRIGIQRQMNSAVNVPSVTFGKSLGEVMHERKMALAIQLKDIDNKKTLNENPVVDTMKCSNKSVDEPILNRLEKVISHDGHGDKKLTRTSSGKKRHLSDQIVASEGTNVKRLFPSGSVETDSCDILCASHVVNTENKLEEAAFTTNLVAKIHSDIPSVKLNTHQSGKPGLKAVLLMASDDSSLRKSKLCKDKSELMSNPSTYLPDTNPKNPPECKYTKKKACTDTDVKIIKATGLEHDRSSQNLEKNTADKTISPSKRFKIPKLQKNMLKMLGSKKPIQHSGISSTTKKDCDRMIKNKSLDNVSNSDLTPGCIPRTRHASDSAILKAQNKLDSVTARHLQLDNDNPDSTVATVDSTRAMSKQKSSGSIRSSKVENVELIKPPRVCSSGVPKRKRQLSLEETNTRNVAKTPKISNSTGDDKTRSIDLFEHGKTGSSVKQKLRPMAMNILKKDSKKIRIDTLKIANKNVESTAEPYCSEKSLENTRALPEFVSNLLENSSKETGKSLLKNKLVLDKPLDILHTEKDNLVEKTDSHVGILVSRKKSDVSKPKCSPHRKYKYGETSILCSETLTTGIGDQRKGENDKVLTKDGVENSNVNSLLVKTISKHGIFDLGQITSKLDNDSQSLQERKLLCDGHDKQMSYCTGSNTVKCRSVRVHPKHNEEGCFEKLDERPSLKSKQDEFSNGAQLESEKKLENVKWRKQEKSVALEKCSLGNESNLDLSKSTPQHEIPVCSNLESVKNSENSEKRKRAAREKCTKENLGDLDLLKHQHGMPSNVHLDSAKKSENVKGRQQKKSVAHKKSTSENICDRDSLKSKLQQEIHGNIHLESAKKSENAKQKQQEKSVAHQKYISENRTEKESSKSKAHQENLGNNVHLESDKKLENTKHRQQQKNVAHEKCTSEKLADQDNLKSKPLPEIHCNVNLKNTKKIENQKQRHQQKNVVHKMCISEKPTDRDSLKSKPEEESRSNIHLDSATKSENDKHRQQKNVAHKKCTSLDTNKKSDNARQRQQQQKVAHEKCISDNLTDIDSLNSKPQQEIPVPLESAKNSKQRRQEKNVTKSEITKYAKPVKTVDGHNDNQFYQDKLIGAKIMSVTDDQSNNSDEHWPILDDTNISAGESIQSPVDICLQNDQSELMTCRSVASKELENRNTIGQLNISENNMSGTHMLHDGSKKSGKSAQNLFQINSSFSSQCSEGALVIDLDQPSDKESDCKLKAYQKINDGPVDMTKVSMANKGHLSFYQGESPDQNSEHKSETCLSALDDTTIENRQWISSENFCDGSNDNNACKSLSPHQNPPLDSQLFGNSEMKRNRVPTESDIASNTQANLTKPIANISTDESQHKSDRLMLDGSDGSQVNNSAVNRELGEIENAKHSEISTDELVSEIDKFCDNMKFIPDRTSLDHVNDAGKRVSTDSKSDSSENLLEETIFYFEDNERSLEFKLDTTECEDDHDDGCKLNAETLDVSNIKAASNKCRQNKIFKKEYVHRRIKKNNGIWEHVSSESPASDDEDIQVLAVYEKGVVIDPPFCNWLPGTSTSANNNARESDECENEVQNIFGKKLHKIKKSETVKTDIECKEAIFGYSEHAERETEQNGKPEIVAKQYVQADATQLDFSFVSSDTDYEPITESCSTPENMFDYEITGNDTEIVDCSTVRINTCISTSLLLDTYEDVSDVEGDQPEISRGDNSLASTPKRNTSILSIKHISPIKEPDMEILSQLDRPLKAGDAETLSLKIHRMKNLLSGLKHSFPQDLESTEQQTNGPENSSKTKLLRTRSCNEFKPEMHNILPRPSSAPLYSDVHHFEVAHKLLPSCNPHMTGSKQIKSDTSRPLYRLLNDGQKSVGICGSMLTTESRISAHYSDDRQLTPNLGQQMKISRCENQPLDSRNQNTSSLPCDTIQVKTAEENTPATKVSAQAHCSGIDHVQEQDLNRLPAMQTFENEISYSIPPNTSHSTPSLSGAPRLASLALYSNISEISQDLLEHGGLHVQKQMADDNIGDPVKSNTPVQEHMAVEGCSSITQEQILISDSNTPHQLALNRSDSQLHSNTEYQLPLNRLDSLLHSNISHQPSLNRSDSQSQSNITHQPCLNRSDSQLPNNIPHQPPLNMLDSQFHSNIPHQPPLNRSDSQLHVNTPQQLPLNRSDLQLQSNITRQPTLNRTDLHLHSNTAHQPHLNRLDLYPHSNTAHQPHLNRLDLYPHSNTAHQPHLNRLDLYPHSNTTQQVSLNRSDTQLNSNTPQQHCLDRSMSQPDCNDPQQLPLVKSNRKSDNSTTQQQISHVQTSVKSFENVPGLKVVHNKTLNDGSTVPSYGEVLPLYFKDLHKKCVACDQCKMLFNPVDFLLHVHPPSLQPMLHIDSLVNNYIPCLQLDSDRKIWEIFQYIKKEELIKKCEQFEKEAVTRSSPLPTSVCGLSQTTLMKADASSSSSQNIPFKSKSIEEQHVRNSTDVPSQQPEDRNGDNCQSLYLSKPYLNRQKQNLESCEMTHTRPSCAFSQHSNSYPNGQKNLDNSSSCETTLDRLLHAFSQHSSYPNRQNNLDNSSSCETTFAEPSRAFSDIQKVQNINCSPSENLDFQNSPQVSQQSDNGVATASAQGLQTSSIDIRRNSSEHLQTQTKAIFQNQPIASLTLRDHGCGALVSDNRSFLESSPSPNSNNFVNSISAIQLQTSRDTSQIIQSGQSMNLKTIQSVQQPNAPSVHCDKNQQIGEFSNILFQTDQSSQQQNLLDTNNIQKLHISVAVSPVLQRSPCSRSLSHQNNNVPAQSIELATTIAEHEQSSSLNSSSNRNLQRIPVCHLNLPGRTLGHTVAAHYDSNDCALVPVQCSTMYDDIPETQKSSVSVSDSEWSDSESHSVHSKNSTNNGSMHLDDLSHRCRYSSSNSKFVNLADICCLNDHSSVESAGTAQASDTHREMILENAKINVGDEVGYNDQSERTPSVEIGQACSFPSLSLIQNPSDALLAFKIGQKLQIDSLVVMNKLIEKEEERVKKLEEEVQQEKKEREKLAKQLSSIEAVIKNMSTYSSKRK